MNHKKCVSFPLVSHKEMTNKSFWCNNIKANATLSLQCCSTPHSFHYFSRISTIVCHFEHSLFLLPTLSHSHFPFSLLITMIGFSLLKIYFSVSAACTAATSESRIPSGSHHGNQMSGKANIIRFGWLNGGDLVDHSCAVVHLHTLHFLSVTLSVRRLLPVFGRGQEGEERGEESQRVQS